MAGGAPIGALLVRIHLAVPLVLASLIAAGVAVATVVLAREEERAPKPSDSG
jgi:hypothetical protein